jgi:hypothetical protein
MKNTRYSIQDEYYTPKILVEPILQYIPENSTIWCPCDTMDSEFVITFREHGHKVIHSHIWDNQDFFQYEPDYYDYIITNIPFSRKLDFLERLYNLNKPFAILLNLQCLNHQNVSSFFLNRSLELLIVDKKVSFNGKTAGFNTSYFCNGFLPQKLIFCHLEHNNSGKKFTPSRMYKSEIQVVSNNLLLNAA